MTSFRSNKYKQILRVGKATIFGKAIKEVLVNMIVTIKYKQILRVGKEQFLERQITQVLVNMIATIW